MLALAEPLTELLRFLERLAEQSGVSRTLLTPLYKTVGIALVVKVGGGLCRDAGESALAAALEFAGTVCALLTALPLLRAPMVIDGEDMEADRVELTGKNTLTMVIHQGKNRQIRRMCAAAGLEVLRLKRVREGGLRLHDLQAGCWKLLTNEEIFLLKL